jgi:hypothetical protein
VSRSGEFQFWVSVIIAGLLDVYGVVARTIGVQLFGVVPWLPVNAGVIVGQSLSCALLPDASILIK